MPVIEIKSWVDGKVLFAVEAANLAAAMEAAVKAETNLTYASLVGARLIGARLDGASLVGASLVGARLDGASLDGASLVGASLVGASLVGASLDGASLDGASLVGASLSWQSHSLIGELLFRAAGQDIEKRKVSGLISLSRDWCWKDFLAMADPLRPWVFETLRPWAQHENTPKEIKELFEKELALFPV